MGPGHAAHPAADQHRADTRRADLAQSRFSHGDNARSRAFRRRGGVHRSAGSAECGTGGSAWPERGTTRHDGWRPAGNDGAAAGNAAGQYQGLYGGALPVGERGGPTARHRRGQFRLLFGHAQRPAGATGALEARHWRSRRDIGRTAGGALCRALFPARSQGADGHAGGEPPARHGR